MAKRPTWTCHSRWCPQFFPHFWDNATGFLNDQFCKDVDGAIQNNYIPFGYPPAASCCKLFCGEPSHQLLQLQCQDISATVAVLAWIEVAILLACVVCQMISICVGRGWRKVESVGKPVFLGFIAFTDYLIDYRGSYGTSVSTPLYAIVGAMNVAAFSYYFSSFKYSIGLAYELTSATALVLTMLPVWRMFSVTVKVSPEWDKEKFHPEEIRELVNLVLVMLVLSVLWVLHSCCYRTVAYRAAWIYAFNKQTARTSDSDFMEKLWVLAGAQGHPTWRTHAGQSIGLYLAVLSWGLSVSIHNLLQHSCKEDFVLFHILLWTAPSILTIAVLATQISMCYRTFLISKGYNNIRSHVFPWSVFAAPKKYYEEFYEAVISYRLGRDSLEVERSIGKYKFALYGVDVDKCLSRVVLYLEVVFEFLAFPGTLVLGVIRWLGICLLKGRSKGERREQLNHKEKERAYKTLCGYCWGPGEETSESSDTEIDVKVCKLFKKHRLNIRLPLLLDNIELSGLTYLLQQLDSVLNEPSATDGHSTETLVQINVARGENTVLKINPNGTEERTPGEMMDSYTDRYGTKSPHLHLRNTFTPKGAKRQETSFVVLAA